MIFYIRRKHKLVTVKTYADNLVGYVWLTFCVVIFLVGFLIGQLSTNEYYSHISPLILSIYGMPIFLSGIILQFRPLVSGGIGCWVLCVVSLFIKSFDYQFLMIPVAMIIAWIIPGYLLRAKHRRNLN
jgi:hypothetical protein